jgi:cyclopropane fatty-acyl-phospholipid synthase-like methyltransferase
MEQVVRDWDYWAFLFRVTHRESIPGIEQHDEKLVSFIIAALELKPGDELLDLACGSRAWVSPA